MHLPLLQTSPALQALELSWPAATSMTYSESMWGDHHTPAMQRQALSTYTMQQTNNKQRTTKPSMTGRCE
jgi:hypothetical protein